ncbi:MAG: hypothetical protein IJ783_11505 [Kiritimatiellae bacterium]|nr:hypothetical protein [Kiritimatiellia bacterium]
MDNLLELPGHTRFPRVPEGWQDFHPNFALQTYALQYRGRMLLWQSAGGGGYMAAAGAWAPSLKIGDDTYAPDPYEINGWQSWGGGAVFYSPRQGGFCHLVEAGGAPQFDPYAFVGPKYTDDGEIDHDGEGAPKTLWYGSGWYQFDNLPGPASYPDGTGTVLAEVPARACGTLKNDTATGDGETVQLVWDVWHGPWDCGVLKRTAGRDTFLFGSPAWNVAAPAPFSGVRYSPTGATGRAVFFLTDDGRRIRCGLMQVCRGGGDTPRSAVGAVVDGDAWAAFDTFETPGGAVTLHLLGEPSEAQAQAGAQYATTGTTAAATPVAPGGVDPADTAAVPVDVCELSTIL